MSATNTIFGKFNRLYFSFNFPNLSWTTMTITILAQHKIETTKEAIQIHLY